MRLLPFLLCLILLAGCGGSAMDAPEPAISPVTTIPQCSTVSTVPTTQAPEFFAVDPIQELLESLTIQERVGQLFLARLQEQTVYSDLESIRPAGFVLFAQNFETETPDTLRTKLQSYQAASKIPLLLAVDEEGGTVTRVSSFSAFRSKRFPSPRQAYRQGGLEEVLETEEEKYALLSSLGLNINLGPVCDLADDPHAFMYQRSLGEDAATTSAFVSASVSLSRSYQVGCALKHFPGYGNNADTHTGIAVDYRSLDEFWHEDLIPFTAGISAGVDCILVSHTIVTALDETTCASLSPAVHSLLRHELGFSGVILTDDLSMDAITDQYGAGEAAVLAVLAGNDLLCSTDYTVQYQAVLDAVNTGRISLDTLNSAVFHVLQWKHSLGLL